MSKSTFLNPRRLIRICRTKFLITFCYRFKQFGKGSTIGTGVWLRPNSCSVGTASFIGSKCWLAVDDLRIGNWVMLAGQVSIVGGDHRYDVVGTPSIHANRGVSKPVVIEDDVWVGHRATIMHGVTLGEGSIIASGSIVTKDVEPYSIVAGCPAKRIKSRFSEEEFAQQHKQALQQLRIKL